MVGDILRGIFTFGAAGIYVIVPLLKVIATFFMAVSTYKLLKLRGDRHKFFWIAAICVSPIIARIVFEIYIRLPDKKQTAKSKGSTACLLISLAAYILSLVLIIVSALSVGASLLMGEISGENIVSYCDIYGNEYGTLEEVPLYDESGNKYTYESAWFKVGNYIDQNGKKYDGESCYLSADGRFYFDRENSLKPYEDFYDYYTDGDTVFYALQNRVYWQADGTIYEKSGRFDLELFDFDK